MNVKANYWVNVGLVLSFLAVFITGILKLRIIRHMIMLPRWVSTVHDWSGIIMGVLVLVHLIQYRKPFIAMTKKYLGCNKCKK